MNDRHDFFTQKAFANIVRYVGLDHHKLMMVSIWVRCEACRRPTWEGAAWSTLAWRAVSSVASSSISVPADVVEVTGEGPTMSLLGLIRWEE